MFSVLVVDDNEDHRFLTKRALLSLKEQLRVEVRVARDGWEALASAAQTPPDIVLLDVKMPGMDGFEVLRRIRESEATRGLPVIMFTSSENSRDVARANELGASGFVTKPLDARSFADLVRRTVLEWARASGRLP